MRTFSDLRSVSLYESKLLMRSWFFRLFAAATIFVLTIWNAVMMWAESEGWLTRSVPSNIPLMNLLMLNVGQAMIAIFLASDFIKRDRKLDTSEVFYVRPLSNAVYVAGKIWGNLKVFFLLNIAVMCLYALFTVMAGVSVDWLAYLVYFFLIPVPTLAYIIGLSVFLMLTLKNQALTFILLLSYIGITLFYLEGKYYNLFDYAGIYIPLMKSSLTGFSGIEDILIHRAMYLFAGIGFILLVIPLFGRLPDSKRSNYVWTALAAAMFLLCISAGSLHVNRLQVRKSLRTAYDAAYREYGQGPQLVIESYDIRLVQLPRTFTAQARLSGRALSGGDVFPLCLNPGLEVESVTMGDTLLSFGRDRQILLVRFGKAMAEGDTFSLSIDYKGALDNTFCYAGIADDEIEEANNVLLINPGKRYVFQTPSYLLATPEAYWYPRPAADYFSGFRLHVTPLDGLTPLSQGVVTEGQGGAFAFEPEYRMRAMSLAIGKYQRRSVSYGGVEYSLCTIEGNSLGESFDAISDTIGSLAGSFREDMERRFRLEYPFKRFSVIETPASFSSYARPGSVAQEMMQPEMVFFPERGWNNQDFDVKRSVKTEMDRAARNGQSLSEREAMIIAFNKLLDILSRPSEYQGYASTGRNSFEAISKPNPYFVYPQMYNFRHNIYSHSRTEANGIVELYLLKGGDEELTIANREREVSGISKSEKAALLRTRHTFALALADPGHRDLAAPLIAMEADRLFAPAEASTGRQAFRDSLYAFLNRNAFRNIAFEEMLDTLSRFAGAVNGGMQGGGLRAGLDEWDFRLGLPAYIIGKPEVIRYENRGRETYVTRISLRNSSDTDGFINIAIRDDDRTADDNTRSLALAAKSGKLVVNTGEHAPRSLTIYAGLSANIPNTIQYPITDIRQERGTPQEKDGDYIIPAAEPETGYEVIVDNEDDALFSVSDPPPGGWLNKWLNMTADTVSPYGGALPWRLPLRWTATTNAAFYGRHIRSAYVIRSGDGSQAATWRVPVPSPGHYDLFYYMSDILHRDNKRGQAEYRFKVVHDGETEDTYLNLNTAENGWASLGTYYFASDTAAVTLTNRCEWRGVSADAVRIVKR
jgi:hypothetical protein